MYIYIYIYIYINVCMYIYIYIYIYNRGFFTGQASRVQETRRFLSNSGKFAVKTRTCLVQILGISIEIEETQHEDKNLIGSNFENFY